MRLLLIGVAFLYITVGVTAFLAVKRTSLLDSAYNDGIKYHVIGRAQSRVYLFNLGKEPKKKDNGAKQVRATRSSKKSSCGTCKNSGAVNCKVCNGTGIDKVNGNVFERWTCTTCKGFGFVICPDCGGASNTSGGDLSSGGKFKTGLTPEQRGER